MPSTHLRVLGRATVERDQEPVRGRAAQSHHLALLAFLALSPGRTASRDRLIGHLWPDREPARARHRLSVALHAIRNGLGREAILTTGDSVRLNAAVVSTDVGDFLDAVEEGDLEGAVNSWGGPFLDGFYLKDGREFERWVETERERLASLHRSALERLAEEADVDGDPVAAVEWRRRITVEAPFESGAALALMGALAASGDLAGAIAHARSYATRVEAELEIPPNPKVLDLADHLARRASERKRAAGPTTPPVVASMPVSTEAPRAPPGLAANRGQLIGWGAGGLVAVAVLWAMAMPSSTGPSAGEAGATASVVVLPFAGADGGAASRSVGRTLAAEIASTLAIVPNLEVVDPPPDAAIDAVGARDARRVGRRAGAQSVVTGRVSLEGRGAEVTARLVDASTGEVRPEATFARELRSVDALVEALSMAVADDLRTRLARYVPHHYTDSESANEAFLNGVYEHRKMDPQRTWVALQHYRRAWEEDPDFALAHAIAGNAYMGLAQRGEIGSEVGWERGREHVMRAIEIDPTLPEAYSVLGRLQLWWDRDVDAAEATLRRAIMLYPTHPDARTWYAYYQLYYLNDFDGAVTNIRRALDVDPLNTGRSNDVEIVLYLTRRFDEVAPQRRHTESLDPDVAASLLSYRSASALREMGMYEEAVTEYESIHARLGGPTPSGLGVTYARMGRLDEAREILREREAAAGPATGPAAAGIARLHAALGDMDRAFDVLRRAIEPNPDDFLHIKVNANFDDFRDDPRFDEILRRIGLPVD